MTASRAARLAERLRVTEGQLYTSVTGLAVGVTMLLWGVPPTLEERPDPPAAPVAQPQASPTEVAPAPSAAPTTSPTSPSPSASPSPLRTTAVVALPPPIRQPRPQPSPAAQPSPTPAPAPTPAPSPAPSPTTSPSSSSSPSPSPTTSPSPGPNADHEVELGRYATASGPLLGPPGEPGQYLPVGAVVGSTDKQSYLRFATTPAGIVTLTESTSEFHQIQKETLQVLACTITDAEWAIDDGASFGDAPAFDPDDCVTGVPLRDGRWTFALGTLAATNGVALVPDVGAATTAQVTFEVTPTPTPTNAR